jgi:hypothetical protein
MVVDGDSLHLMEAGEVFADFWGSRMNQTKIPNNQLPHIICENQVSWKI